MQTSAKQMADFKMAHVVLVFAVIGLYNMPVIHSAESDIEIKVGNLEYLLNSLLKHDIKDIKDTLRTILNDKPDHECCNTGQQQGHLQITGDGMQRLVIDVTTKTKAMIKAFSTEKKQLRTQKTYLTKALDGIRKSFDDHENQTRNLVDQFEDDHQADFDHLMTQIELGRRQSQQKCDFLRFCETQLLNNTKLALYDIRVRIDEHEKDSRDLVNHLKAKHQVDITHVMTKIESGRQQSQEKLDSVQHLVETLSADIDSIKSNIDGINRTTNSIKAAMPCKAGWIRQLDSCVLYVSNKYFTWIGAQTYCNEHGVFLVEPYSSESLSLLIGGLPIGKGWFFLLKDWWIGATNRFKEGVWQWASTGRSVGTVLKLEYDELNKNSGGENCAALETTSKKILIVKCNGARHKFICEIKL